MMTLSTNFGTEQDLKDAVAAAGRTVVEDEKPPVEAPPAEEKKPEPVVETKVETPADKPAGEAPPTPGEGEKEKSEPSQLASKPAKGFKSKAEKAQELVDHLQVELELERGSKTKLQEQLAAAQAELAKHQPAEPGPPAEPELVRPKRPTREECDYDDAKYEAALDKHEQDMDAYREKKSQRDIQKALDHKDQQAEQKRQKDAADAAYQDWVQRRDAGAANYEDWLETFQSLPKDYDFPADGVMKTAVAESPATADLMYFFAKDRLDNDGKEMARIAKLPAVSQVRELFTLEQRIASEREQKAAPPEPAAPAPAAKPVEKAPIKPKPAPAAVVDPIEPVGGGRAATAGRRTLQELAELAAAGDKPSRDEYFKRRAAREG